MMFHNGWFGGMMGFGLLFWVVIIVLVVWAVKTLANSRDGSPANRLNDAEEILKQRYARGEINREQFEQMKKDLSGKH